MNVSGVSPEEEKGWEGFAERKCFKTGMKK